MTGRGTFRSLIAALAALALSGCTSEDSAGRFLVEPDKYLLYSCTELATAAHANFVRQHELEILIAKAGSGSGGQVVSNLAYRPEYVQLHGEMNELRRAAANKNCKPLPVSGFTGERASDQAVR